MAKQDADRYTLDMLDKPKRGRPRKPNALTPAQRARAYRARKRAPVQPPQESIAVTADGWYFPGSDEWHAQRKLLGMHQVARAAMKP